MNIEYYSSCPLTQKLGYRQWNSQALKKKKASIFHRVHNASLEFLLGTVVAKTVGNLKKWYYKFM